MDSGTALTSVLPPLPSPPPFLTSPHRGPVQSPALHEQPQSYLPPILAGTNCTHAPSPLECLRAAPVAVLSAATQTYLAGLPADVIGFLPSLGGYIAERASGVYQKQAALYPVITGTNVSSFPSSSPLPRPELNVLCFLFFVQLDEGTLYVFLLITLILY